MPQGSGESGNLPKLKGDTRQRGEEFPEIYVGAGFGKIPRLKAEAGGPKDRKALAAAYEMDDFVDVAGGDLGCGPAVTGEDVAVALDGDAAGGEAEMGYKIRDGEAVGDFAGFAIDGDGHG